MDVLKIILALLSGALTPALRNLLVELLNKWEIEAKKTPSQIDDFIVTVIRTLVGA